ncbi:TPA: hypothetical protein N0F65_005170 [Lagenidium giganteum]|uniref:Alpha-N-acetylglucosaminidase n=1 Tax=Lagenidium giganteum TaxID=4803 RepID=A0AAV2Z133_9STRA|nr:TPA: hypothetical protein N0F65_005170 [Lagenidium giganteum]
MRALTMRAFVALLLSALAGMVTFAPVAAEVQLKMPDHDPIAATQALIRRRLGDKYVDQISLRVIPQDNGLDVFEACSNGDKVDIGGSSATALAYGLQWYLKHSVETQVDWDNHELDLPDTLPACNTNIRQRRAVKYTYYQNVCTVSYSSWTWGWDKWEKHIDWMALNGINMPLAFTGQEKVWQNTFKYFNISDAGLNKFFAGSAFLAWGRMGNVRGSWVKGPTPQAFIDDQFELQLLILARMRELGMLPALPAFAGHIPEELHLKYPDAKWSRSPNWGNFTDEFCCVYMLDPTDPLYLQIGKKFVEEQTKLYNYTSSLYQCDTYNEMDPDSTDPTALAAASKAVIDSMTAADPNAVWLMQGWLFMSDFWKKDVVRSYLGGVPNDKMIILDLYSEVSPIWNKMDNYFGKSWIYCVLHNFGGNTGMRGDLPKLGSDPVASRIQSNGTMIGVGLTMEGIFQNYVVYDLTMQMGWEENPVTFPAWVDDYARSRYHGKNEHAQKAWRILLTSVYNRTNGYGGVTKNIVTIRPHWKLVRDGFMPTVITYDPKDVVRAWRHLLAASKELGHIETFRHDLVDVTRQFLSDHFLHMYLKLEKHYHEKTVPAETICTLKKKMMRTIRHLDEILSTSPDWLLGTWIADARALGRNETTLEDYYEYEARNQVTRWGDNNDNVLSDYAAKEWAGLINNYYRGRWSLWLTEVCESYKEKRDIDNEAYYKAREAFELKWQLSHEHYPTKPRGCPIGISSRLFHEYNDDSGAAFVGDMLAVMDNDINDI